MACTSKGEGCPLSTSASPKGGAPEVLEDDVTTPDVVDIGSVQSTVRHQDERDAGLASLHDTGTRCHTDGLEGRVQVLQRLGIESATGGPLAEQVQSLDRRRDVRCVGGRYGHYLGVRKARSLRAALSSAAAATSKDELFLSPESKGAVVAVLALFQTPSHRRQPVDLRGVRSSCSSQPRTFWVVRARVTRKLEQHEKRPLSDRTCASGDVSDSRGDSPPPSALPQTGRSRLTGMPSALFDSYSHGSYVAQSRILSHALSSRPRFWRHATSRVRRVCVLRRGCSRALRVQLLEHTVGAGRRAGDLLERRRLDELQQLGSRR